MTIIKLSMFLEHSHKIYNVRERVHFGLERKQLPFFFSSSLMGKKSFLDITIRSNFVTLGRLVLNTTTKKVLLM